MFYHIPAFDWTEIVRCSRLKMKLVKGIRQYSWTFLPYHFWSTIFNPELLVFSIKVTTNVIVTNDFYRMIVRRHCFRPPDCKGTLRNILYWLLYYTNISTPNSVIFLKKFLVESCISSLLYIALQRILRQFRFS